MSFCCERMNQKIFLVPYASVRCASKGEWKVMIDDDIEEIDMDQYDFSTLEKEERESNLLYKNQEKNLEKQHEKSDYLSEEEIKDKKQDDHTRSKEQSFVPFLKIVKEKNVSLPGNHLDGYGVWAEVFPLKGNVRYRTVFASRLGNIAEGNIHSFFRIRMSAHDLLKIYKIALLRGRGNIMIERIFWQLSEDQEIGFNDKSSNKCMPLYLCQILPVYKHLEEDKIIQFDCFSLKEGVIV